MIQLEERTHGPLRYNVASGKLTFGDSYHYKPDAEGLDRLWVTFLGVTKGLGKLARDLTRPIYRPPNGGEK